MKKLSRSFYAREAIDVARDLIGTILVRGEHRARIVETEAYVGPHDLACHASKGRTSRTEVMFGRAGHAYVYFIYGMYDMFNIVTGKPGHAQAVLVRAAEPLDDWHVDLAGPGKLARAFAITRRDNGLDLTKTDLFIVRDASAPSAIIRATPRIGVEYAKHWQHELLRFIDNTSRHVSGPKDLRATQVPVKKLNDRARKAYGAKTRSNSR